MTKLLYIPLLLFSLTSNAIEEEVVIIKANILINSISNDYSHCAAFFMTLANGLGDARPTHTKSLQELSQVSSLVGMQLSAINTDTDIAINIYKDIFEKNIKKMNKELNNNQEIFITKNGEKCGNLLSPLTN